MNARASKRNVLNPVKTINKPSTSLAEEDQQLLPEQVPLHAPNAEILQMLTKVSTRYPNSAKKTRLFASSSNAESLRATRTLFHSLISCSKKDIYQTRMPTDPMDQNTMPHPRPVPTAIYRSYIYDKRIILTAPKFHHLLQQGLEIFEHITPAPSQTILVMIPQRRDPPHPITPDTSSTKAPFANMLALSMPLLQPLHQKKHQSYIKGISIPILNFDRARSFYASQPINSFSHILTSFLHSMLHITPSKFEFSNKFLLEIGEPQTWVTTFHMEILMYMLAERHRELLYREQLAFTTPFLASGIQEIWKRFKLIRRKDRFQWDKRLTELVLKPGQKWIEDVITIYTPMCWDEKHWVELAINLNLGCVEILDPLPSLYSDKKVVKFMEGVLTSLPYLVKKVAKHQQTQFRGLKPFYWKRMEDIYTNERSGDCGPVSIKFMELHANGDPAPHMSGITDCVVDDLRKQYAMDIYKTIVIPAYHTPTFP
ncbi:hypothetical protein Bca52824_003782 [Brassica carinata]|uniref:Ubiquitin-like protease family profile domain-containing protein n=1 Tax=Brassica carinata TaxID=52824 RepID=A0A8X8BF00_BRACI|nr:hypothetical protein Bca52824_003782 [Brassica carinata]